MQWRYPKFMGFIVGIVGFQLFGDAIVYIENFIEHGELVAESRCSVHATRPSNTIVPPCGVRGDPMNLRFFNNFVHFGVFFPIANQEMAQNVSDKTRNFEISIAKIDGLEDEFPFGMGHFSSWATKVIKCSALGHGTSGLTKS